MIVVSDTTAISNLHSINKLWILEKLFGEVIIPIAVFEELSLLNNFELTNYLWIKIVPIKKNDLIQQLILTLDKGEVEAIILALELNSTFLLIDEKKGRQIAKSLNIKIIGLLGILLLAKQEKIIETVKRILDDLVNVSNFRISTELYNEVLIKAKEY